MNVLFPAFLLGALAVAIPIVLHFLRRDVAPEVPFSAVRLISQSPVERSRRRRLRDLLLLAARVAALLLLAAAFARPYAAGSDAGADVRIVAVDRSFSLSAPGRFEAALRMATEAVEAAPRSARVAVIAFDDRADVLAGPGSAADARAALAEMQPRLGATRYEPLLARASEVAAGSAGDLIVVTDLQASGWDAARRAVLPSSIRLELRDVGAGPANLTVTDVRVERDRVVASIRNTGDARDSRARILVDGREVAAAGFAAAAHATTPVAVAYRAPDAGSLTVAIEDAGGLAADDSRHILLHRAASAPVLILTPAGATPVGFYLARALEAAQEAAQEEGEGGRPARVLPAPGASALTEEQLSSTRAIVLLATRGLDRRARDGLAALVRGGAGLLIAAGPDVEPDVISSIFGWQPPLTATEQPHSGVRLAATDLRHPIFQPFGALIANLGQVTVQRAWTVDPAGWDVLGRFTDGAPALLERREGRGRVVLFASDLDRRWNDFPLHPVFVPFVVETIRHAGSDAAVTDEYTVGSAPVDVPATPGIHTLPATGRPVAVNVDLKEGAGDRMTPAAFESMIDRLTVEPVAGEDAVATQVEARQSLWQYGLLLMLATLVIESVVGRVVNG